MLSREGRQYMQQGPWLALWPGLCLTIVVYGAVAVLAPDLHGWSCRLELWDARRKARKARVVS